MAQLVHSPLEDFFKGFFIRPVEFDSEPFGTISASPIHIDAKENAEAYVIRAELPGVSKQDIRVHINGKSLVISAEKKQEKSNEKGDSTLYSECFYGKVSRTLHLGQDIDEEKSSAKFSDGILELRLHKKSAGESRYLTVS